VCAQLTEKVDLDTLGVASERSLVEEVAEGQHDLKQLLEDVRLADRAHLLIITASSSG